MPKSKKQLSFVDAFKSDFPASIIVFLVALPLCMGIAIASGAPAATGLITGIVGGLIVGLIAGSPLQVSGPAAGLFVLVATVIDDFKQMGIDEGMSEADAKVYGLTAMGMAVLIAGLIQLTAGLLRFGGYFRAVSPAVIQGMLSGIGVLILASQFHVMVDDKDAAKPYLEQGYTKGVANLISIPQSVQKGLLDMETVDTGDGSTQFSQHFMAAAIGVGTILVLIFWKLIPIKQLKLIPAPVIAVTLAAVVAAALQITVSPTELEKKTKAEEERKAVAGTEINGAPAQTGDLAQTEDDPYHGKIHIEQVKVPSDLTEDIRLPTLDTFWKLCSQALFVSALTIALVASAETMLCATAVDQMQTHARTDYDRELTAQGVGNMICGFLGALPMTGVIVRSSANVDAGGRTRMSAFLHGVWLLLFVAALPWVLNYIPMAALAAVLVFTGWRLINFKAIYKLWQVSVAEGLICLITLSLVVGVDLLKGVIAGIVCTAARLLWKFSRLDIDVEHDAANQRVDLRLNGAATFLALPRLTAELDNIEPTSALHVHLENLSYVDHACLELFVNWEKQHEASGGTLVMDWEGLKATFKNEGTSHSRRAYSAPDDKTNS